jgi:hypothetical protein
MGFGGLGTRKIILLRRSIARCPLPDLHKKSSQRLPVKLLHTSATIDCECEREGKN